MAKREPRSDSKPKDWPWLRRVWSHYWAARWQDGYRLRPTSFWACVRATIAICLELKDPDMEMDEDEELAWRGTGTYRTADYGDGEAWDYIQVRGLRYRIGSDGSL